MTVYQRAVLQLLIAIVKLLLSSYRLDKRAVWEAEVEATHALGYAQGHMKAEDKLR